MTKIKLSGIELLRDSLLNKGTAFTEQERKVFKLEGFLPSGVENQEIQVSRVRMQLSHMPNDLAKYIYLANLQSQNETIFCVLPVSLRDYLLYIMINFAFKIKKVNFYAENYTKKNTLRHY